MLSKNDTFKFHAFRFLEKWAWINNNLYSFLIPWPMRQHGTCIKQGHKIWYFFLLWYFLLEMVSVMNEPHYHIKKVVTCLTNTLSNDCDMLNHKVNNIQIILYRSSCSQMLYKIVVVHKGVLKNLTSFTGKHLCWV